MKNSIFKRIAHSTKSRDFRAFVLFLLLSFLIWNIEKLRQTYTVSTELKVRCNNVPAGFVTDDEGLTKVRADVTGNGFSLLRMSLTDSRNISVNVSNLRKVSIDGNPWAIFQTHRLSGQDTDMPAHVSLTRVYTDTVMIQMLTEKRKRLPVIPRDSISLQPQHVLSGPRSVTPDSVTVKATNNIIDTLTAIYCTPRELTMLKDTTSGTRELMLPPNVLCDTNMVNVTYFVEPITEKKVDVSISYVNVPEGYTCKIFPAKARITFTVGLSKFERADLRAFRVVADFAGIKPGSDVSRIRLHLENSPDFIHNISLSPTFAEFLLERER